MASKEVRRIALVVEYDGTRYRGFQVQSKGMTVQGTLEDALQSILGKYVKTQGAGRTDAGAHAYGQVVAFNTESEYTEQVYLRALNASLPQDIRVLKATQVGTEFDPRRNAERRRGPTAAACSWDLYLISGPQDPPLWIMDPMYL